MESNEKVSETVQRAPLLWKKGVEMATHPVSSEVEFSYPKQCETNTNIFVNPRKVKLSRGCGLLQDVWGKFLNHNETPKNETPNSERVETGVLAELKKRHLEMPQGLGETDDKGRRAIHFAAQRGQISVLAFLLNTACTDVNAMDSQGNTALHEAVQHAEGAAVDFLLTHGASPEITNSSGEGAIHMAATSGNSKLLEILLSHSNVDVNMPGPNNATPLHYACYADKAESVRTLLKHGARPCSKCDMGLFPIHLAVQHGSSETLEIMLEEGVKRGYKREDVLNFVTKDQHTPLHTAINAGELKTVQICLKAGSKIDAQKDDGSNAVHIAAAQGAMEMLRLMFDQQPELRALCLQARDKADMTPLHKAAMFDKAEVVNYFLDEGADIDALTNDGYTPLLLAAAKRAWRTTDVLSQRRASFSARDPEDKNLLHLVIQNGGRPDDLKMCMCAESMQRLLNEQDVHGCTPLHYASQQGQLRTISSLLQLGAALSAKTNSRQSPLHFAARYGRINTCRQLLDDVQGHTLLNETDNQAHTALHAAAENGHTRVVELLISKGAGLYKDVNSNTPIHLAAKHGYTHTVAELLNTHPHLINSANRFQETPLHLAAREGHPGMLTLLLTMGAEITMDQDGAYFVDLAIHNRNKDACIAFVTHDRWTEALGNYSKAFGCPMMGIIKYLPEVCQIILDRCRTPSGSDNKEKNFHYVYDFRFLQMSAALRQSRVANNQQIYPLYALNGMVLHNRVDCLAHPVCVEFLRMKWNGYGLWLCLANLLLYLVFLGALTGFVASASPADVMGGMRGASNSSLSATTTLNVTEPQPDAVPTTQSNLYIVPLNQNTDPFQQRKGRILLQVIILCFCALNVIKELAQMVQQRWRYVTDPINLLEWILYITCSVFILPYTVGLSTSPQWHSGAVAVFLAWFNLLIFLQRFDFFGLYVVMFLQILRTMLKVIAVFSVLIIAFGMAFYILLCNGTHGNEYDGPGLSLMTTAVMMLGNIAYTEHWVLPSGEWDGPSHLVRFGMLSLFVLFMPILLINLLIGLAVGDIEAVQKDARLKRLAMQVELHTELEDKLPQRILNYVDKNSVKIYPNNSPCMMERITAHFVSGGRNAANEDNSVLENQTYLYQELHKQKARLKDISGAIDKQHFLLKLVLQKMEIHTEADDVDDSGSHKMEPLNKSHRKQEAVGWSSPAIRHTLLRQAAIVNTWKSTTANKAEKC